MVKKLQKKPATASKKENADTPLSGSIRDSAQQIWQAGLGAFNKAQVEGSKAFEALVKEGILLQRKTQSAAEEKLGEATSKMSTMASEISSKASGQWDKLESIFEERVAKALNKLGVPSAQDVNALIARIDELNKSVQSLSAKSGVPAEPKKAAARKASQEVSKIPKRVVQKATETATPATGGVKPAAKRASRKTLTTATTQSGNS